MSVAVTVVHCSCSVVGRSATIFKEEPSYIIIIQDYTN